VRFYAAIAVGFMLMVTVARGQQAPKPDGEAPVFRAGAATSNLTPRLGRLLVGGFEPIRATHIHDELHARCLVLDDGQTKIAFVICDSLGIDRQVFDHARRLISKETGIPGDNVLMSATHTHSGPSWHGRDDEDGDYPNFLARRIADGVARAVQNLEPARIGWGAGREPNQVFNRRWKMKPGPALANPFGGMDQVRMNPPRLSADLLEPAGPTDPEISFLSVQSRAGRPIALLANYSLHYVGGTRSGEMSADYFAVFADRIQQLLGADRLDPPFVGLLCNGTSGDVNNNNFRAPGEKRQPYEQMRRVAHAVAAEVDRAHQFVKFRDWVPLAAQQKELSLATRKPTPALLAWARQTLAKPATAPQYHPRERNYAQRVLALQEAPARTEIILQTLRVGDVGIAAIPFEVFAETGLEIKERSPFRPTFTVSLANGTNGYLPTPAQHKVGGYETWLGTNRVEIDASVKIVDTLLECFSRMRKP
jgi:neutral ceramidase